MFHLVGLKLKKANTKKSNVSKLILTSLLSKIIFVTHKIEKIRNLQQKPTCFLKKENFKFPEYKSYRFCLNNWF